MREHAWCALQMVRRSLQWKGKEYKTVSERKWGQIVWGLVECDGEPVEVVSRGDSVIDCSHCWVEDGLGWGGARIARII